MTQHHARMQGCPNTRPPQTLGQWPHNTPSRIRLHNTSWFSGIVRYEPFSTVSRGCLTCCSTFQHCINWGIRKLSGTAAEEELGCSRRSWSELQSNTRVLQQQHHAKMQLCVITVASPSYPLTRDHKNRATCNQKITVYMETGT